MLHRWWLVGLVVTAACKSPGPPRLTDAGDTAPDAGDAMLDAPPDAASDAGNACDRVGFSQLPWVPLDYQPRAVVVADVNRDAMPDLIIRPGTARPP